MPAKVHRRCLHCGASLAATAFDSRERPRDHTVREYTDGSVVTRATTRERYTCPRCGKPTTRDTRRTRR